MPNVPTYTALTHTIGQPGLTADLNAAFLQTQRHAEFLNTLAAAGTGTPPPAAPTITALSPTSGAVGAAITLTGTNLTGATAVTFNGLAATFTVLNATTINATVPAAATSGAVAVTTPGGTATGPAFTLSTPPAATAPTGSLNNSTRVYTITSAYPLSELLISTNGGAYAAAVAFTLTLPDTAVPAAYYTWKQAATAAHGQSPVLSFPGIVAKAVGVPVFSATSPNPTSGPEGTQVTVQGSGLFGATVKTANGLSCPILENSSDTQVVFSVAFGGATSGGFVVTNPNGTATTAAFTVIAAAPVVHYFNNETFTAPAAGPTTNEAAMATGWTAGTSWIMSGNGQAVLTGSSANGATDDLRQIAHGAAAGQPGIIRVRVTAWGGVGSIAILTASGSGINNTTAITGVGDFSFGLNNAVAGEWYAFRGFGGATATLTLISFNNQ